MRPRIRKAWFVVTWAIALFGSAVVLGALTTVLAREIGENLWRSVMAGLGTLALVWSVGKFYGRYK